MAALSTAFIGNPASAATAEAYLGSAAARGLNVSVANPVSAEKLQATLGSASAKVTSAMNANAEGIGQVLPTTLAETKKTAAASPAKVDDPAGSGCAIGQGLGDLVSLGIACGSASASVKNNLPIAESTGSVAGLNLDGTVALDTLGADTAIIGNTLGGVLDTVCDTLKETCDATTTVKDLVESVLKTKTLEVGVGESSAKVVTTANAVTSSASASGAVVRVLPLPQVAGLPSTEPLATIEVSSAKATAVYDRVAGKSLTPSADPAIVRVKFNTVLTKAYGVNEVIVPAGQDLTILNGTPLQSRIVVAGTQIVTNADGTQGAIADGVKLHLAQGLGASSATAFDGGVLLELAHAEAGIAGAPAKADPVPNIDIPRDAPKELPRTGGTPWIPLAGASVLALAVIARRATVRAATARIEG